jgi:hypothetical protein
MTLGVENVVYAGMDGDEKLGRAVALEALHFALAPADRETRILRSVVLAHPSGMMPL